MWTIENRTCHNRDRLRYPSDLTDAEWEHIAPLIPAAKRGGKRRLDMQPSAGSGLEQPAQGDKSMAGEIAPSYGFAAPVPVALTGRPARPIRPRHLSSIAIWGDSILEGRNDTARQGENSALGWAPRAATYLKIGHVQVSKAGTTAYQQRTLSYFNHKAQLIDGCSHVVTNFGTNDIGDRKRRARLVIEDMSLFVERLQNCGHEVILSTLLPRRMPETGALLKGDTEQTIEELLAYNAWVRTDPFGFGIFDAAAEACDPADPTRWRLDLGAPAQDGLHPGACIHAHLALAFARRFGRMDDAGRVNSAASQMNPVPS